MRVNEHPLDTARDRTSIVFATPGTSSSSTCPPAKNAASAKGYRRLARKLAAAKLTAELLERVARADHFGRTTEDALLREFPAGDGFLARMRELSIDRSPPRDVVLGRHLIARGMHPGPEFGEILERCRELQDETGWTDPEQILAQVLGATPG